MTNSTIALDKRVPLKDGTYPLKIFIKVGKRKYINFRIGISLALNEWDGSCVVRHAQRGMLNSMIRARLNAIEEELFKLEMSGELRKLSLLQIKSRLQDPTEEEEQPTKDTLVKSAFLAFSKDCKAERTRSIYLQTLSKLDGSFNLKELNLIDINNKWLREWDNSMRAGGLSINAISVHMRNLRAVFNRAIDDEIIGQESYPFRKFKIKSEATAKRSLSVDELRTLINYPCEPHQVKYVDYFILIFLLMGINLVDLSALTEIKAGRISYRRAKTSRLYSVKVEPEALAIIEKYRGKDQLLDILDRSSDYHNFLARMNKGLQSIGEIEWVKNAAKDPALAKCNKKSITPLFPQLSTYWARHTWATIAASLDIPKETIAAALGHGQNSTTDIYIDFDQKKVDKANRRVIDYVFRLQ